MQGARPPVMPSLAAKRPLHGPNAWRADDGEHIAKTPAIMHARLILSLPAHSAPDHMTGRLHQYEQALPLCFETAVQQWHSPLGMAN